MPKDINNAGTASTLGVAAYGHPDQLPTDALRLMEYAKRQSIELGPSWYRNLVNTVYPNDSGVCF